MNRSSRFVILTALALAAVPLSASAQEWTRFRGPNGTGLSEWSFPTHFGERDYAWSVELPGTGHSSPVAWGDKVFLTCTDETSAQRMVLCLSAKTGAILWKKDYGSHTYKHHGDNSYTSSTPTVDADRVYVCWNTPEEYTLVALTLDGADAWKTDLGAVVSPHGSGNSPIIVGDVVLIGSDLEGGESHLFGVDKATGKMRWTAPRKTGTKYAFSTPIVFQPKSGAEQAIFTNQAEGMTAIEPGTGKVIWQLPDVFDARTVGSPTTGDGLIFATCGEGPGGHILVAVRPADDGKSAQVAWKTKPETPYVPTPIVKNHKLFYWSDRGMVTCARTDTGEKIWQEHVPGSYYASPICAGNTLFNVTKKCEVIAISSGDKFELLGQSPLPFSEKCHSSLAISGGRMFIRTYSHLYCIRGTGGQASR